MSEEKGSRLERDLKIARMLKEGRTWSSIQQELGLRTPSIIASVKKKIDQGIVFFDASNNPTFKAGGKRRLYFLPAIKLPRKYYYVALVALIIATVSYKVGSNYPQGLAPVGVWTPVSPESQTLYQTATSGGPQVEYESTGTSTECWYIQTGATVVVSPVIYEPKITICAATANFEYFQSGTQTAVYIPPSSKQIGQKLVKTAELTIEVEDMESSLSEVRKITAGLGGYIADSNVELIPDYYQRRQGWIVVRVPTDQFEAAIEDLQGIGKVTRFRVTTSEVAEAYIDYQARLENLKREEQRLLEFFSKAQNISEIMIVEGQLFRVREQIEQLTAQIKNLENKIAYASITLNLYEPLMEEKGLAAPPSWAESMLAAATNGLASSTWAVLVGFATILPYLVVLVGVYAVGRWTWPKIRSSIYHSGESSSKGSELDQDE